MGREGEGRGREGEMRKRGRRGGGEKMRGIVIGGMVLGLLMGCNNGGEDPQKVFLKSVVSLGNDFLNIFTSFTDVFSSSLGFKKEPQKSDVANYFKNIQKTVQETKDKLNDIINNMEKEGNPNAANAKGAVNKLVSEKLDKIIDGAKKASEAIGSDATDPIGYVNASSAGGAPGTKVDDLVKGIKDIVDIVLKNDQGDAKAGDDLKADDSFASRSANAGEVGKLFDGTKGPSSTDDKKAANDASKAVGAVTGADILKAIVENDGNAAKLANNSLVNTSIAVNSPKDAEVAGGI